MFAWLPFALHVNVHMRFMLYLEAESLDMDTVREKIARALRIDKKLVRELLAECIGTFFLVVCFLVIVITQLLF